MLQELRYGLAVAFLRGNEVLNRRALPVHHAVRKEILLQYILAHRVVADSRAHCFRNPSFLLGNYAVSERDPPSHDVFRRMWTEQHTDSNIVDDVADDATNQWGKDKRSNDHNSKSHSMPKSLNMLPISE